MKGRHRVLNALALSLCEPQIVVRGQIDAVSDLGSAPVQVSYYRNSKSTRDAQQTDWR